VLGEVLTATLIEEFTLAKMKAAAVLVVDAAGKHQECKYDENAFGGFHLEISCGASPSRGPRQPSYGGGFETMTIARLKA
jgi:hypothetical protein